MRELILQTLSNLAANKLRSLLTMFGIMWGIISIVLLSAMNEGFQRGNQTVLRELGKNIVIIRNGRTSLQAGGERAGRIIRLDIEDVHALKDKAKLLEHISPELMRWGASVKSDFNSSTLQMSGVWPVFQQIRTIEVDRGRLLNQADNDQARNVVVIGFDAAKQLFADRDPVGKQVTINGTPYTVVGRIRKKEQDSNYTGEDNARIFMPYEAMKRDFPLRGDLDTADSLSAIIASPFDHVTRELEQLMEREGKSIFDNSGPVEIEVRTILAQRHGFDAQDKEAISMWNTAIMSVMFGKIMSAMGEFFLAVSIITLVLGGIGVMNIMLIAVRERTREIGVRKAIGATSRGIQWQFLTEGLFLTLLSGGFGLALGAGLCKLANLAPLPARFAGMIITPQTAVFAVIVLVLVGTAASVIPARRAAELAPVDALRYEK
jgi:putative ABC transport system permease protein